MDKYELALRLHKARARAWAVDYALGGNPIAGVLYAAEHSLETAEKAAAQWRQDVDVIRAVMREIEAEKQPAEPEANPEPEAPCANPDGCDGEGAHERFLRYHNPALSQVTKECDGLRSACHPYQEPENQPAEPEAPCVKCGLSRDGVSECGCKMHDGPQPCHPGHTPNIMRHPYQAPEKPYDGPRYASGEQPMVGDEVRYAATEAGAYRVTDANEGNLAAGLVRIVRQSITSSHYAIAATTQALTLVRRAEVTK